MRAPIDIIHQVNENRQWHNQRIDALPQLFFNDFLRIGQLSHVNDLLMTQVNLLPQVCIADNVLVSHVECVKWRPDLKTQGQPVPGTANILCRAGSAWTRSCYSASLCVECCQRVAHRIYPVNSGEAWGRVGLWAMRQSFCGEANAEIHENCVMTCRGRCDRLEGLH